MLKKLFLPLSILIVIGVPFLLRDSERTVSGADDRLVVFTPHNEAIRHEFGRGFEVWYQEETGRSVNIDWRVIGGTSDIVRFLNSSFLNAFRNEWTGNLGRNWSQNVENSFRNHRLADPEAASANPEGAEARQAFLDSEIGIGVDLFFGGGSFDFIQQARAGQLVPSRILETHPEWFAGNIIPATFSGEPFYDPEGRWIGTVLSSFGIIYNYDALDRVGFEGIPESWQDLASPKLVGSVGLADPSKSGSSNKAFEMIIQREMQLLETELLGQGLAPEVVDQRVREEGWLAGMQLIQKIAANARYFTDSATKPSLDVSQGDCAAGMSIDFYGRFQQEILGMRGGEGRFAYLTPAGGSTVSVDPVGLIRGAPNREVAERFIEFVLSIEGQKLWDFRVGTEGGPSRYALRRLPIRKDIYLDGVNEYRSDPEVFPYDDESFIYRPEWTGALFQPMRFIIKTVFIDIHDDLQNAWTAINVAREAGREEDAAAAERIFSDLSAIDYNAASGTINSILRDQNSLLEVELSKELSVSFREQFRAAARRARGITD